MSVKIEVTKILERHKLEGKGNPVWLVHALVKVRSEGEDYVRLFVPLGLALQEGMEYSVLFNGVALRVKGREVSDDAFPFDAKISKPSGSL